MTLLEVGFRYVLPPADREVRALDRLRQVYGVQKIRFDEKARVIRVEYDASRLSEYDIAALVRASGIGIRSKLEG